MTENMTGSYQNPSTAKFRTCSRSTRHQGTRNSRPYRKEKVVTISSTPRPHAPPPVILECPKCRQRVIVQLSRFTAVCLPCGRRMEGAHK